MKESPLDALRNSSLIQARQLVHLYDQQPRVLWYLLLAWELKETGRVEEAREILEELPRYQLEELGDYGFRDCATFLLKQLFEVSPESFEVLEHRLLGPDERVELCRMLITKGEFEIALSLASKLPYPYTQVLVLQEIARGITDHGNLEKAPALLEQALSVAEPIIEGMQWWEQAMGAIAEAIVQQCQGETARLLIEKARSVAHFQDDKWFRRSQAIALGKIAVAIASTMAAQASTLFDEAFSLAQTTLQRDRSETLMQVIVALAETTTPQTLQAVLKRGLSSCKQIKSLVERTQALAKLATVSAQNGNPQVAEAIFNAALGAIAREIPPSQVCEVKDEFDFDFEFEKLPAFDRDSDPSNDELEEEYDVEDEFDFEFEKLSAFDLDSDPFDDKPEQEYEYNLTPVRLATDDRVDPGAISAFKEIAIAFTQIGKSQTAAHIFNTALASIEQIKPEGQQSAPLKEIAIAIAQTATAQTAASAFDRALSVIARIKYQSDKIQGLKEITNAIASTASPEIAAVAFKQAILIAQGISEQDAYYTVGEITLALVKSATSPSNPVILEEAITQVRQIKFPQFRAMALGNIAAEVAGLGDRQTAATLFQESLAIARTCELPRGELFILMQNLATSLFEAGEVQLAATVLGEGLVRSRKIV